MIFGASEVYICSLNDVIRQITDWETKMQTKNFDNSFHLEEII